MSRSNTADAMSLTPRPASAASAQKRIASLAALTAVHRAFHWLHLHQPQLRQWLLEIVRIPAPPFGEKDRAAWFAEIFRSLALTKVEIDAEGNVMGQLSAPECAPDAPVLLVSAHLDTVFPVGTRTEPHEDLKSSRISAPGVCDNGAGLTALLGLAAAMSYARIPPPAPILFMANVGEEGEGDLRGMRYTFSQGPYRHRIAAAIALEGSGGAAVVTRGLGSLRLRLSVTGPGGHSWTDASAPNPIFLLSRALADISQLPLPTDPRTTLSVGHISGGTSVNSIPESASASLDLRSTDPGQIRALAMIVESTLTETIRAAAEGISGSSVPQSSIEIIGNRPTGALPDEAPLLHTLRAVDRHLSIRTEERIGSTDTNLPLSLGIPAIAIGGGGTGGGIHTLAEWYDPAGRELALRRILLTVLDTVQHISEGSASGMFFDGT